MNVHVDTVCDKCNYKKSKYENPPPKLVIVPFCMYVFQYGLGWSMIHDPDITVWRREVRHYLHTCSGCF